MATWEVGLGLRGRAEPERRMLFRGQIRQLGVAGVAVVLMALTPYWVLRAVPPQSPVATAIRAGALEATPSVRRTLSTAALRPRRGLRVTASPAGWFVVAFGRFERREAAEVHARLVRSKGYTAKVLQSGAAYLVVSRPYRSLADAQFWLSIFGEIGLEAKALTRLEASGRRSWGISL